jgi:hypothetical protein
MLNMITFVLKLGNCEQNEWIGSYCSLDEATYQENVNHNKSKDRVQHKNIIEF